MHKNDRTIHFTSKWTWLLYALDSGANMYLLQHTLTSDMMLQPTKMLWLKVKNKTMCIWIAAAAAKLLQSCPTLCDSIDGSPPGSPVPGILQARTLEWVAISFSNASKWKVKVKSLSHARLLVTPWTAAHQAPPSMGFSRQEYRSGVPLPSPIWIARELVRGLPC